MKLILLGGLFIIRCWRKKKKESTKGTRSDQQKRFVINRDRKISTKRKLQKKKKKEITVEVRGVEGKAERAMCAIKQTKTKQKIMEIST